MTTETKRDSLPILKDRVSLSPELIKMVSGLMGEGTALGIFAILSFYYSITPTSWLLPWAIGMFVPTIIYTYTDNHKR